MGMWDIDTGGKSVEEIDAAAGPLQPGYYRARVIEAKVSAEDASVGIRFQVCHGLLAGKIHTETLRSPMMAESSNAREMSNKRAVVYLSRLGIVPKELRGQIKDPDWQKAVGKEVIIKISHRSWEADPSKNRSAGERNEIDFGGIWPLDHKELKALKPDVLAALGLAPATAGGAAAAPNGTTTTPAPGAPGSPEAAKALADTIWK